MVNYSIIFTSSGEVINSNLDKYVCFDNKIHIRFRDFNKEEYIIGFEKKLTYLLSYLVNYSYIPTLLGQYNNREVLINFILYGGVVTIIEVIKNHIGTTIDFDGILLKSNYKKDKTNYNYFGNTDIKFFPLHSKGGLVEAGNLDLFLNTFNVDLYNYLFNDNYVIWLHNKEFKVSKKFEKRRLKKIDKQSNKNSNIVELW